jgi:hypothetical protein
VAAVSARYEQELGANAYAVLNVVTELASRPPDSPLVRRDRHALQRRAGEWASGFALKCVEEKFDLGQYLAWLNQNAGMSRPAVAVGPVRRSVSGDTIANSANLL